MVRATTVWKMTSAAWDMMTMVWALHPCTLEAMAPCRAWDPAPWVWTDEDSGKTQTLSGHCISHLYNKEAMRFICYIENVYHLRRSCEDTLDGDMGGADPYAWGIPMTMERGSMASLDSTLRKAPPSSWRQPELPEVIAMLNYRLDPVKTNAAAFLQHLTFKNDKVKQI